MNCGCPANRRNGCVAPTGGDACAPRRLAVLYCAATHRS